MLFSGNGSLAALVALSFSFGISGYRPEQLQEHIMTKITIKDLADSVELDREENQSGALIRQIPVNQNGLGAGLFIHKRKERTINIYQA
jgi:hypothetical protein